MQRRQKRPLLSWHTPPKAPANVFPLRGLAPAAGEFTDYDRRSMKLYTAILVLAEDGAGLDEIAEGVLGFEVASNPDWARRVTRSHLARAQWIHAHIWPCID